MLYKQIMWAIPSLQGKHMSVTCASYLVGLVNFSGMYRVTKSHIASKQRIKTVLCALILHS